MVGAVWRCAIAVWVLRVNFCIKWLSISTVQWTVSMVQWTVQWTVQCFNERFQWLSISLNRNAQHVDARKKFQVAWTRHQSRRIHFCLSLSLSLSSVRVCTFYVTRIYATLGDSCYYWLSSTSHSWCLADDRQSCSLSPLERRGYGWWVSKVSIAISALRANFASNCSQFHSIWTGMCSV
jgi:hypothetical protein